MMLGDKLGLPDLEIQVRAIEVMISRDVDHRDVVAKERVGDPRKSPTAQFLGGIARNDDYISIWRNGGSLERLLGMVMDVGQKPGTHQGTLL
jgi:hypothetical protein